MGVRATPAGPGAAPNQVVPTGYPTRPASPVTAILGVATNRRLALARIEEHVRIDAPVERVWAVLVDWEGQSRWMQDARDVRVLTDKREGRGVVIRAATDILGLVVDDDMEITEWEEPRLIGVRHLGMLIRGVGAFELVPLPDGKTRFTWWEEVQAPFGALGDTVAGLVVVPWVSRVFRRSLAALKAVCEDRQTA